MRRLGIPIVIIILCSPSLTAGVFQGIGGSAGLISALGPMSASLNPGFETNLFFLSELFLPLEIGAGMSYQIRKQTKETKFLMFPITASYIRNLFSSRGRTSPFVKIGAGVVWEKLSRDVRTHTNLDPLMLCSLGMETNTGRKISLRLELIYKFVLQKYISEAKYNGQFLGFSVGICYHWE